MLARCLKYYNIIHFTETICNIIYPIPYARDTLLYYLRVRTAAAEEVMARTLSVMRSRLTRFICKHTRVCKYMYKLICERGREREREYTSSTSFHVIIISIAPYTVKYVFPLCAVCVCVCVYISATTTAAPL